MNGSILLKTLRDKRWFVLGWSLGIVLLTVLMTAFFPAMKDSSFGSLLKDTPEALKGFVGDLAAIQHFSTYLATQLFDIRGSIFVGIIAIMLGISLTAGEEEKGYTRTLVSLPISRTRLFVMKWVAMLIIMALICALELAAIYISAPFVGESVDNGWAMRLALGQWLVCAAIGSIVFAGGSATGKRGIATMLGVFVVTESFLITTFSASVDWLKDWNVLSVYHYFPTVDIVNDGFDGANLLVLSVLILVPTLAALLVFRRRDISA